MGNIRQILKFDRENGAGALFNIELSGKSRN
jgi:hypothetical protein